MLSHVLFFTMLSLFVRDESVVTQPEEKYRPKQFYFGADLSYVNQILDHGGVYKDNGVVRNPYEIFSAHGANLARFRLWHHPDWTRTVYGQDGKRLYNDLHDVERGIRLAKEHGMEVLLDFQFSDTWADPGKQEIPKAWQNIRSLDVLKDSVYEYVYKTLHHLDNKGLQPEFVQIGNETNCGMLYTNAPDGFPTCNVCKDEWINLGEVLNKAIDAIQEVNSSSAIQSKIILHVADPKNVEWWFDNIVGIADVRHFDLIGFSYYPLYHPTVRIHDLSESVRKFRKRYNKDVMILETAYPWTTEGKDNYSNIFGAQPPVPGFPFTIEGQYNMMHAITQEIIDGGGSGIIYWEPAWISAGVKDLWGTGSSWENAALFDFDGNAISGMRFMKDQYQ